MWDLHELKADDRMHREIGNCAQLALQWFNDAMNEKGM
jgi:hypothetical protein